MLALYDSGHSGAPRHRSCTFFSRFTRPRNRNNLTCSWRRPDPNVILNSMSEAEPIRADSALGRYRALLEVSEAIAAHRELPALFHELTQRLPGIVRFDFLSLVLPEPARNVMRLHILESRASSSSDPGPATLGSTTLGSSPPGR